MVKPAIPIKYQEGDALEREFWNKIATILRWRKDDVGHDYAIREVWGACVYDRVMRPSEGDVVIDAGAQIGSFTVRASQMVGESGKVYAFEPAPYNFEYLMFNTEKLKNVKIFQKALWSSAGNMTLYLNESSGGHSLIPWKKVISTVSVQTTTLDEVVAGKVDFMKIDVEASELELLKGATHILENYHPFIVMEIHTGQLIGEITSFLSKYEYKCGGAPAHEVFTYSV